MEYNVTSTRYWFTMCRVVQSVKKCERQNPEFNILADFNILESKNPGRPGCAEDNGPRNLIFPALTDWGPTPGTTSLLQCGSFNVPQNSYMSKNCETGPMG